MTEHAFGFGRLDSVDWDTWFNGEGLKLPVAIEETYDTTLADLVSLRCRSI